MDELSGIDDSGWEIEFESAEFFDRRKLKTIKAATGNSTTSKTEADMREPLINELEPTKQDDESVCKYTHDSSAAVGRA